jgi:SH3-like domain-containing protein
MRTFGLRASFAWLALALTWAAAMTMPAWGAAADYRSITDAATVLYDAPSTKAKKLFVLGAGYPLEVMVTVEGWTKVRDAGGSIGWVEARALGTKRNVLVRSAVAEVRAAPDAGAPVVFKVSRGVLLEWVENVPGGWTRVRHADAGHGFLPSTELWGS